MRHEGFPEYEGTHLRVRLVVEQVVEWMVVRHCLAATIRVFIEVQRQSCHCLRQYADAGIHGGHLHGRAFCYRFTGGRAAEEESVVAARRAVLGLSLDLKRPEKIPMWITLLQNGQKKSTCP